MSGDDFDVIVIGSGPGGTGCATLLQKRGIRTLLVEKNETLGGKMISIESDGYAYDLFPHGQVPMHQPAFEEIFAELGVSEDWAPGLSPDDPRDMIRIAYRARDWKEYRSGCAGPGHVGPHALFQALGHPRGRARADLRVHGPDDRSGRGGARHAR